MRRTNQSGSQREQALRKLLEAERDGVLRTVRATIREGRNEGTIESVEVQDEAERAEADAQAELEFGLLQIQGETLERINEALEKLRAGNYGRCSDCGSDIPMSRLQALPFATRCKGCEESRETSGLASRPDPRWQGLAQMLQMGR